MSFIKKFIMDTKEFVASSRRKADNHVGWMVQRYKDGIWQKFGKTYAYKEDAISALVDWQAMFQGTEFRVYEEVA